MGGAVRVPRSVGVLAAAAGVIAVRPVSVEDELPPAPTPPASDALNHTVQVPGPEFGPSTQVT
jgi:hypothetical protein